MADLAGWIAPTATMIAAMMTAANLGARITGWGFVVFCIGSVAWTTVGFSSGQTNLVLSNAFLTVVNVVGIWRWLGRQASYDKGSSAATDASARAAVPSLYAAGAVVGARVSGPDDEAVGTVVDAMLCCHDNAIAYVVVSTGGVGGVGETLHQLDPAELRFGKDGVRTELSSDDIRRRPLVKATHWPEAP
ncbi:PRC-barrel domain containing protein [Sphingomonas sp. 2R-10]|uniref:PRC-barrel domain containing protein n=1 Tax=Sphingomonas sp. 2R-10 TaxID=3045148 RepID=UPI000F78F240|nr:PRC-barrel domain containing protein [Sphingomonas sp. 2R-10]MDJ0278010.1 PRC-barrel domain containing protein [Sphingomonas sp. 2R-10]